MKTEKELHGLHQDNRSLAPFFHKSSWYGTIFPGKGEVQALHFWDLLGSSQAHWPLLVRERLESHTSLPVCLLFGTPFVSSVLIVELYRSGFELPFVPTVL